MPVSPKRADQFTRELEARLPMNALRQRRPEALEELVSLFAQPLHRFVARKLGAGADAEDVLQTVFTRALQQVGEFDGTHEQLRSWMFTVAYRATVDVRRERNRAPAFAKFEPAAVEPVDLETAAADVRRAMETLDADEQTLLTLRYQDDFSNQEIARILGLDANHVGVLLYRAKQNLRKAIR